MIRDNPSKYAAGLPGGISVAFVSLPKREFTQHCAAPAASPSEGRGLLPPPPWVHTKASQPPALPIRATMMMGRRGHPSHAPTKGGHLHQQLRCSNLSLKEKQPHGRLVGLLTQHLQDHKSHQPHQPAQEQGDEEEKHVCLTRAGSGVTVGTAPCSSSPRAHAVPALLLPMGMHGLADQVTFASGLANMVKTTPANPNALQIGHLAPLGTRQWSGSSSLGRT